MFKIILFLYIWHIVSIQCQINHYEVLGINKNANETEIRRAFKDLSLE
jgi:DnaJ-class molecular chaperone